MLPLPIIAPAADTVTLPPAALIVLVRVRLPAATLIRMSPPLVTTLLPPICKSFVSEIVRLWLTPVMLAFSVVAVVVSDDEPLAVISSTLASTVPVPLRLPCTALRMTFCGLAATPAFTAPKTVRLPLVTVMLMGPDCVETPVRLSWLATTTFSFSVLPEILADRFPIDTFAESKSNAGALAAVMLSAPALKVKAEKLVIVPLA